MNTTNTQIIYPELSFQIMGILFDVHNSLGNELQEKIYQQAVAERLRKENIPFTKEFHLPIQDQMRPIGKYFLDFLIDRKIALELKVMPSLTDSHIRQLLAYLQVARLKLGIIANFRTRLLTYKRVVNPSVQLV